MTLAEKQFLNYKNECLRASKELCYSKYVIDLIECATTENELRRIMMNARKGNY